MSIKIVIENNLVLVITFFIVFTLSLHCKPNELIVLDGGGYPPYSIGSFDETQNIIKREGMLIDFLNIFEKKYPEYKITYIDMPWARAKQYFELNEKIDIFFSSPNFLNDTIKENYIATAPLFHSTDCVITNKSNSLIYNNPKDLFGLKVATILGYGYGQFDKLFEENKIVDIRVKKHTQAIKMLKLKRVDAYFGNYELSTYLINSLGFDLNDFKFSNLYSFNLHLFISSSNPDVLQKMNQLIDELKKDGK